MTRGARVDASVAARAPTPITVLVVDDEAIAREGLESILASMPRVSVLPGCRNGNDAIAAAQQSRPDVIFLDIEMPGIDGFGVARMLTRDPGPIIVFVTAYSSYAVGAFELEASDYLVKPFSDARVSACVVRVRRLCGDRDKQQREARLAQLVVSWAQEHDGGLSTAEVSPLHDVTVADRANRDLAPKYATRLLVPNGMRTSIVPVDLIDWITADDDYVALHTRGKTHLLRGTLGAIAAGLHPNAFVRTHRSVLVNVSRITELRRERDGSAVVVLEDGRRLPVGRRRYEDVRQALAQPREGSAS
ncbi:MAG: LytTR family DNA-binding domain-containing protein [Gemmatimonadaceae bacterium]